MNCIRIVDEWPKQNFFPHIKQTCYENKEKYELGDFKVIQYQILKTIIENCKADSKEKYHWYLGSERVDVHICEKEMPGDDNEQVLSTQNVAF